MKPSHIAQAAIGIVTIGFIAGIVVAWCLMFIGVAPYWVGLAQGAVQVAVTTSLFLK